MSLPLEGIRVLDWTAFQQGPIAASSLADLGADVIKIEEPRGEPARGLVKIYGSTVPADWYYQNQNRGKRGIVLDLKLKEGQEVLYKLVEKADVFVTNFREDVVKRLNLDYETLAKINPKLIYALSSSYGPKGPDANLASSDFAGQARGGLWSVSRSANLDWAPVGAGQADEMGGFTTAYGIILALFVRERTGIGQRVDASLLGGQLELGRLALQQQLLGFPPNTSTIAQMRSPLWNIYQCKDEKWLCLSVLQADRFWPTFCKVLGIEDVEKDPRFENTTIRGEHINELLPRLKEIFLTRTRIEWIKTFHEAGMEQCGPVQDYEDLTTDPQVLANDYIVEVEDSKGEKIKVPGIMVKLSKTPGKVRFLAPELGQHTEEVLIEVGGYTWDDLARLREAGVY